MVREPLWQTLQELLPWWWLLWCDRAHQQVLNAGKQQIDRSSQRRHRNIQQHKIIKVNLVCVSIILSQIAPNTTLLNTESLIHLGFFSELLFSNAQAKQDY